VHYVLGASLSDRNLMILTPVIWLLVPRALSATRQTSFNITVVAIWVAALCTNHAIHSSWLTQGFKSEWQESARLVDTYYGACADSKVPVFAYVDPERDAYFYSYYLEHDFDFHFVDRSELRQALVATRGSPCPIVFWAPHGLVPGEFANSEQLRELGYRMVTFEHAIQWQDANFAEAFVVVDE
jgi:hypothetical protein